MSLMTLAKLQQKIAAYEQEGWVKISERPFERLCNVVAPKRPRGADSSAVSQSERTVSAKLCAIIAQQGKTSAATALFNSRLTIFLRDRAVTTRTAYDLKSNR